MDNRLSKRIIPCLDIDKGRVVKGKSFINLVDAGDPSELSKHYNAEGADELVFLDITASHEQRKAIIDVVEKVSSEVFIPLTVGGGIRNLDNISELLLAGADKVSINTSAIENPEFIKKSSSKFGSNFSFFLEILLSGRKPPSFFLRSNKYSFSSFASNCKYVGLSKSFSVKGKLKWF